MSAAGAVARLADRQVRRGGLAVLGLSAAMTAFVVLTYPATVGSDQQALAALAANPAIRALFGEPVGLRTAGGFTVWRTGMVLTVLVSVWGLLAVTRITRGQEEVGRWNLLLAGPLPLPSAVALHVAVVSAWAAGCGLASGAALVLAGASPGGAAAYGAGLALTAVCFVAVAGLAAQLFPARGPASGAAGGLLLLALLLRMLGDGWAGLSWLRWCTPFGLQALTRPYDADRPSPLAVLVLVDVLLLTAVLAAARRDVGDGLLGRSAGRRARLWLLGSVTGFAARRAVRPVLAWSAGVAAYYLLIGLLAATMAQFLGDNPMFSDRVAEAGLGRLDTARGYAAVLFTLLAVPVGVFAALGPASVAAEERRGRLTPLLAGPVTRTRLLLGHLAAGLAGAAVLLSVAAVALWLGGRLDGSRSGATRLALGEAFAGSWNAAPVVLLSLAAAVLALGVRPGAVMAAGSLPGVGGFLLLVLGRDFGAPGWLIAWSPFAHLNAVPAEPVDRPAAVVMVALAVLVGVLGAIGFARRDLRG